MEEKNLVYLFVGIIILATVYSMIGTGSYGMMGRNNASWMMGGFSLGFMILITLLVVTALVLTMLFLIKKLKEDKRT